MTREFLDISVTEVAAHAPRPQSFYDQYCEDSLDIIEARWPTRAGYVCLVQHDHSPGWLMVRQTPDLGFMTSQLRRWSPNDDYKVIASRHVDDRFKGFDALRQNLGRLAGERKNHTAGVAEWFRISSGYAEAALYAALGAPPRQAPALKGLTIVDYRRATREELAALAWTEPPGGGGHDPHVLILSNGLKLFASRDEEGNGPGSMFIFKPEEGLVAVDGIVFPPAPRALASADHCTLGKLLPARCTIPAGLLSKSRRPACSIASVNFGRSSSVLRNVLPRNTRPPLITIQ